MAEQTLASVNIPCVEQQNTPVSGERQFHNQGGNPGSPVESQNFSPGDNALSDGNVMLVNFDGRLDAEEDEKSCTGKKKHRGDGGREPLSGHPTRERCQTDGD